MSTPYPLYRRLQRLKRLKASAGGGRGVVSRESLAGSRSSVRPVHGKAHAHWMIATSADPVPAIPGNHLWQEKQPAAEGLLPAG